MKNKNIKAIPKFKNKDKERDFWVNADSTEYFDMDKPIKLDLSKLKPTTESISLRLPGYLLSRIKEIANSKDVPYQSLMKMFLSERVEKELYKKTDYFRQFA
ncbi:BrnA antitoxin family protein [Patescibacteria group bacterium]|nr:BrnA antitoxin family protein [Patescibacteria group bacterium]